MFRSSTRRFFSAGFRQQARSGPQFRAGAAFGTSAVAFGAGVVLMGTFGTASAESADGAPDSKSMSARYAKVRLFLTNPNA